MQLTGPTERVLRALLADPTGRHYGYQLMKDAGLKSGTLYPILARLQQQGILTAEWDATPAQPGRPPRKHYQLTGDGIRTARLELAHATHDAPAPRGLPPAPHPGAPGDRPPH